jgi:hydroxymethylpyrimidine/phosphomethylpyrimidine kinase
VPVVLTIAGSDSIGGAGVQADLKAIASLGVHGTSAITAVTAQNTMGVRKIIPLRAEDVLEQLEAVLADTRIDAVKVGMLFSPEVAQAVGRFLKQVEAPAVVDPVLFAGAGDALHGKGLLDAIKREVLPNAAMVTPNRHEAEALASMNVASLEDAEEACREIAKSGAGSVLLKGGHMDLADIVDIFYDGQEVLELRSPRLPQKVHGGGCTLSSYIAGYLAMDLGPREAVIASKRRIFDAIALSYRVGGGMNVIDPLATLKKEALARGVLEQAAMAVARLESTLDPAWIPVSGTNLAYALPNPQGFDEVCSVEGGLVRAGKCIRRVGEVRFGASHQMAGKVLALARADPTARACLALMFTPKHLEQLRLSGLEVVECAPEALASTAAQGVPDVVADPGGPDREPMILIIGRDPADILDKISFLLEGDQ